ncbi:hypothetical protein OG243_42700 [Streptomyces sp. NBC_01318]|uniref:hypothetical protein n=1 Tax=Streptomyces sp. NBC_01318 TaxID=2903823 RepID=UPI002E0DB4F0|nr:hypothetical protein OG243_42700 [Streptomyces sp. NBC_01318]
MAALMVAGYHYLGTPTPHFWGEIELRDFAPFLHEISRYGWLGVEFNGVGWSLPGGSLTPFTSSTKASEFPWPRA